MKSTDITVSKAARNLSQCVERVYSRRIEYRLLKNGKPVARLVPDSPKVCLAGQLAEVWSKIRLSAQDVKSFRRDFEHARQGLVPLKDKWQ